MMLCLWQNQWQLLNWTSHVLLGFQPCLHCLVIQPFLEYYEVLQGLRDDFRQLVTLWYHHQK